MTLAFLFAALFLGLAIGLPIAFALGVASLLSLVLFGQESLASLSLRFVQTMQQSALLAVPFFLLTGTFMTTGGVARRMIALAIDMVGHVRGGLAIASVLACVLFAAVSGSSPATVMAVGSIAIGGMVRAGYSRPFAAGVICNAGTLGILMPPSIVMVVYAAATETSVGRLFVAGILPSALLALMLTAAIYWAARRLDVPCQPRAPLAQVLRSAREAVWGVALIAIILGGIYGGVFTPTEAAATGAVYAFLVAVLVHRDLAPGQVVRVMADSGRVIVMLMFIIGNAGLFAYVLTTQQVPQGIALALLDAGLPPWLFLVIVNVVLLLAGNVMEPTSIVLILAPIIFPVATRMGIDPIHLGIMMVVNMEIGLVHPPVGLNLFVTAGIADMSMTDVIKAALPWLGVLLIFLIIITYVPAVSTLLPTLAFGPLR